MIESEEQKEKILKKNKQSLRNLCDTIKWGVLEGEEGEKGEERRFEGLMLKTFDERHEYKHQRSSMNSN